jgi:hypothetical protein
VLTLAIVDANEKTNRAYADLPASVVSTWLAWECRQADVPLVSAREADVILLAYAGSIDWRAGCVSDLRRLGIEPNPDRRALRPYIIAGGPVDATPMTALSVADALCVGEGYRLVRGLLALLKSGNSLADLRSWLRDYPHAIEGAQVRGLRRDPERPWLLAETPEPLASPDTEIDWSVPPTRSDDRVVRVLGSKGCRTHCAFCATSYRQPYAVNPDGTGVVAALTSLKRRGERVSLMSNDPADLPWYPDITVPLDSESFTVREIADPANRRALIRHGVGVARFGVEGLSERIRRAWGKPVANDDIVSLLTELHAAGVTTHLFLIVGAPYETEADWAEWRQFWERLGRALHRGLCRAKMTTYLPTPPAPLARYVPSLAYVDRVASFRRWVSGNAASRHLHYVAPRLGPSHVADVAEQLSVSREVAARLASGETTDLAPTVEDARRLPWEIVRWPARPETRWRIAETYRGRMAA